MNIDYIFTDEKLLHQALTHGSCAEQQDGLTFNNQRLEFLGDAILGAVIADLLYAMYPAEQEGDLARRYAALVCGDRLADVADQIELGDALRLSNSEENADGRENRSNLEDGCEALIGAIYLDGGMKAATAFIHQHWKALAESVTEPPKDPKTALQEWAQARHLPLPEYRMVSEAGPAHDPEFTMSVEVLGYPPVEAAAKTKKMAAREAADILLKQLP